MQCNVYVRRTETSPWEPALLTTDDRGSRYGQPIVKLRSSKRPHGPSVIYAMGLAPGADAQDYRLLEHAAKVGYRVVPRSALPPSCS